MNIEFESNKILDESQIVVLAEKYRLEGKKIGCISGSFDLITGSHYKAFFQASQLCDALFVLLNSNSSVSIYKGPGKPIIDESERAYIVSQPRYVDGVHIFDDLTPINILDKIKPDVFFNAQEWGKNCIEKNTVEKHGGHIESLVFEVNEKWNKSSSELIKKIIAANSVGGVRAVFLDRDGVINDNKEGYIHQWKDFVLLPQVCDALKLLVTGGYKIIIVTNQSGVARNMYDVHDIEVLHTKMTDLFRHEGINIDAIYYCPHHPEDKCNCRKPNSGMFIRAVDDLGVNLSKSYFVGDSASDIEAGLNVNLKTIYIGHSDTNNFKYQPEYTASSLFDAVKKYIIQE